MSPKTVVVEGIAAGMDVVGERLRSKEFLIPILAATPEEHRFEADYQYPPPAVPPRHPWSRTAVIDLSRGIDMDAMAALEVGSGRGVVGIRGTHLHSVMSGDVDKRLLSRARAEIDAYLVPDRPADAGARRLHPNPRQGCPGRGALRELPILPRADGGPGGLAAT